MRVFSYLEMYDYGNKYVPVGYVEIVYGASRTLNSHCKKDNLEQIFALGKKKSLIE